MAEAHGNRTHPRRRNRRRTTVLKTAGGTSPRALPGGILDHPGPLRAVIGSVAQNPRRSPMIRHALPLTLILLSLAACGHQETAAPAPEASSSAAPPSVAETSTAAPAAPSDQPAGGSGRAPLSPHPRPIAPQANSQQAAGAAGSVDFGVPKEWQSQPVKPGGMRVAQASIPGPGGP